jgi:peroxiredoxin
LRDDTTPSILRIGEVVPPLKAKDSLGHEEQLAYEGILPTVLYVFKPTCVWCQRNEPNIKFLAHQCARKYRFVAVSLTSRDLGAFLAEHQLGFPTIADLDPDTRRAYKLGATPETVVLSSGGKVVKVWLGEFSSQNRRDIEHFFSVTLPEPEPRHLTPAS